MEQLKITLTKVAAVCKAMDGKQRKGALTALGMAVLVLLLAILPVLAEGKAEKDGYVATLHTDAVTRGDLDIQVHGGGTLAEEKAVAIRLPAGVKLTEFYVENYTTVKKGDALAGVDRVSVMTAISSVQETLDYLKEEISAASVDKVNVTLSAPSAGRVKAVYAAKGDDVAAVMSEHGALAVISIDGRMAVSFASNAPLSAGDGVWVSLPDGKEVRGRVESALDGTVVVTVEDQDYAIGTEVEITDDDDDRLGSGKLYVNSAWKAVAYSGTVSAVNVRENTDISAGRSMFSLQQVDDSAEYELLSAQHREYEELMLELFVMYQTEALPAPCDGVVSGADKNSIHLLSNRGNAYTVSLLANAPNGNDEATYTNFVGKVSVAGAAEWSVLMNPNPVTVTDYLDLSEVDLNPEAMTRVVNFNFEAPVYENVNGSWVQAERSTVSAGDVMLFAADESGNCVWMVRVQKETGEPMPTPTPVPEVSPELPQGGEMPNNPMPEQGMNQQMPQGFGGMSGFGGGFAQEECFDLFDLKGTEILYVTPQNTVTLTVSVDEGDVSKLHLGQTGTVAVDVLKGESYTGTITEIAMTGTNEGGSSKFAVEVTLDRAERMLVGMNATVSFTVETVKDVLLIPVAALTEDGGKTVVHVKQSKGLPSAPVAVETGRSDGSYVEIISGLTEHQPIFYAYYDTPDIENKA